MRRSQNAKYYETKVAKCVDRLGYKSRQHVVRFTPGEK